MKWIVFTTDKRHGDLRIISRSAGVFAALILSSCGAEHSSVAPDNSVIVADYVLTADQTHNKFSAAIEPAITVPSGAVIEAFTHEATGGQFTLESTVADLGTINLDLVHTLTGPVYVEGAEPGDTLAVTLLELEPGDWGWTALLPGLGFLSGEENHVDLKTYPIDKKTNTVEFADGIRIPLQPFPGVMGVAPATADMLNTTPPRANGGNMDDRHIVAGTTVYFPIFVEGALFSIGDTHAVQGMGEVGGSAVEVPMRIVYKIELIKGGRKLPEPQYETDAYYATTGFSTTIDEAAKKATRYMIDHIVAEYSLSRSDAYMLCSLACDLKIAEVVDVPNMLVAMHLRKDIFQK